MSAWTQFIEPGPALIIIIVLVSTLQLVNSAPFDEAEPSAEIEYYPVADATGCYYNFEHYDEGDRIITNEPCLNCTCHNRMLMCYLRVCPFTKAIGQDCKMEKKTDQCCPVITCPEVPVQLVSQGSTTPSTEVGHLNEYGCSIDKLFYADGAKVPSNPNNPCEVCYCIRNKTACIIQDCTLTGKVVEGCRPVYVEGVCCPVRYDCEHPELETTPRPLLTTTTTTLPPTSAPNDCIYNNEIYADGALVKKDVPCEKCYCMRGDIVCAVQECGPTPLDKVNCTALPAKEDQCCPDTYECDNISEEDLTTISSYEPPTTQPTIISSDESTAPPVREEVPEVVSGTQESISEKEEIYSQTESHVTESATESGTIETVTSIFTEAIEAVTSRVTEMIETITSTITQSGQKSTTQPEFPSQGVTEKSEATTISDDLTKTDKSGHATEPITVSQGQETTDRGLITEGFIENTETPESDEQKIAATVPAITQHDVPSTPESLSKETEKIPTEEQEIVTENIEPVAHDEQGEPEQDELPHEDENEITEGLPPVSTALPVSTHKAETQTDKQPQMTVSQEDEVTSTVRSQEEVAGTEEPEEQEPATTIVPESETEKSTQQPTKETSTVEAEVTKHPEAATSQSEGDTKEPQAVTYEPETATEGTEEATQESATAIKESEAATEGTGTESKGAAATTEGAQAATERVQTATEKTQAATEETQAATEVPKVATEGAAEATIEPEVETEVAEAATKEPQLFATEKPLPGEPATDASKDITSQPIEDKTEIPSEELTTVPVEPERGEYPTAATSVTEAEIQQGIEPLQPEISTEEIETGPTKVPEDEAPVSEHEQPQTDITKISDDSLMTTRIEVTTTTVTHISETEKPAAVEDETPPGVSPIDESTTERKRPEEKTSEQSTATATEPAQIATELQKEAEPVTAVTVEKEEPAFDGGEEEEPMTTEKEAELEYITEIVEKETEMPQSMNHVSETVSPIAIAETEAQLTEKPEEPETTAKLPEEPETTAKLTEQPEQPIITTSQPEEKVTELPLDGLEHKTDESVTEPIAEGTTPVSAIPEAPVICDNNQDCTPGQQDFNEIPAVVEECTKESCIPGQGQVPESEGSTETNIVPLPCDSEHGCQPEEGTLETSKLPEGPIACDSTTGCPPVIPEKVPEEKGDVYEKPETVICQSEEGCAIATEKDDCDSTTGCHPVISEKVPEEKGDVFEKPETVICESEEGCATATGKDEKETTESNVIPEGPIAEPCQNGVDCAPVSSGKEEQGTTESGNLPEKPISESCDSDHGCEISTGVTTEKVLTVTPQEAEQSETEQGILEHIPENETSTKKEESSEKTGVTEEEPSPETETPELTTEYGKQITNVHPEKTTEAEKVVTITPEYTDLENEIEPETATAGVSVTKATQPSEQKGTEKPEDIVPEKNETSEQTEEPKLSTLTDIPIVSEVTQAPEITPGVTQVPKEVYTTETPETGTGKTVDTETSPAATELPKGVPVHDGSEGTETPEELPGITQSTEQEEPTAAPPETTQIPVQFVPEGTEGPKEIISQGTELPTEASQNTNIPSIEELEKATTDGIHVTSIDFTASPAPESTEVPSKISPELTESPELITEIITELPKEVPGTDQPKEVTTEGTGLTEIPKITQPPVLGVSGVTQLPEQITTETSGTQTHEAKGTSAPGSEGTEAPTSTQKEQLQEEILTGEPNIPSGTPVPDSENLEPGQITSESTQAPLDTQTTKQDSTEGPEEILPGTISPETAQAPEEIGTEVSELTTAKASETSEQGTDQIPPESSEAPGQAIPDKTQAPIEIDISEPSVTESATEVVSVESERDEEEHGIPGEGSCLVDGRTYRNNSIVPPINQCQTSCKCVSSILQCELVTCTPPPSNLQDCMPIFQSTDSCCPTYSCSVTSMKSDSPILQTTAAGEPVTIGIQIITGDETTTAKSSPTLAPPSGTTIAERADEATRGSVQKPEIPKDHVPVFVEVTTSKADELPVTVEDKRISAAPTTIIPEIPRTESELSVSETDRPEGLVPESQTIVPLGATNADTEIKEPISTQTPIEPEVTRQEGQQPAQDEIENEIPVEPISPEHCGTEHCAPVLPSASQAASTTIAGEQEESRKESATEKQKETSTESSSEATEATQAEVTRPEEEEPYVPAVTTESGTEKGATKQEEMEHTDTDKTVTEETAAITEQSPVISVQQGTEQAVTKQEDFEKAAATEQGPAVSEKDSSTLATTDQAGEEQTSTEKTVTAQTPSIPGQEGSEQPITEEVTEMAVTGQTPAVIEQEQPEQGTTEQLDVEQASTEKSVIEHMPATEHVPVVSGQKVTEEVVTEQQGTESAVTEPIGTEKAETALSPGGTEQAPAVIDQEYTKHTSTEASAGSGSTIQPDGQQSTEKISTLSGVAENIPESATESIEAETDSTEKSQQETGTDRVSEKESITTTEGLEIKTEVPSEKKTNTPEELAAIPEIEEAATSPTILPESITEAVTDVTAKSSSQTSPGPEQSVTTNESQPESIQTSRPAAQDETETIIEGQEPTAGPTTIKQTEKETNTPSISADKAHTTEPFRTEHSEVTTPSLEYITETTVSETAKPLETGAHVTEVPIEVDKLTTPPSESIPETTAKQPIEEPVTVTETEEKEVQTEILPQKESQPEVTESGLTTLPSEETSSYTSGPTATEKQKPAGPEAPTISDEEGEASEPTPVETEGKGTEKAYETSAVTEAVTEAVTSGDVDKEHVAVEIEKEHKVPAEGEVTKTPGIKEIEDNYTQSVTEAEIKEGSTVPSFTTSQSEINAEDLLTSKPTAEAVKPEIETATTTEKSEEGVFTSAQLPTEVPSNASEIYTSGPYEEQSTKRTVAGELSTSAPVTPISTSEPATIAPTYTDAVPGIPGEQVPELPDYQPPVEDYEEEDQGPLGPGTCRYGGKVYVSAQQIPRDDPCDFCFCFRSDIICLQQSCPPPIPRCHEEPIRGFCCPRYECPVGMATAVNITTSTTTTTTTLPPHFLPHAYKGRVSKSGCQIKGRAYQVGDVISAASGPCLHCTCGGDGEMKCDPKACSPEPMLRQMIAAAASRRRR